MKIAITANGPGEFAGWVRPLVHALRERDPQLDCTVVFVPDDYATGREPDVAHRLFPGIRTIAAAEYARFALGRRPPGMPRRVEVVQYLGGDLLHARRVHALLGGTATAYKYGTLRFARVFAVDDANRGRLVASGIAPGRIDVVGNLAIDGALAEAAGAFGSAERDGDAPAGGVVIMPGTRRNEIANMVPFFLQTVVRLRAIAPELPVSFAISPFTSIAELERALAHGGTPRAWGTRGNVVCEGDRISLQALGDHPPVRVVRDAMHHASRARLAVTLPGTKCIELAALGVPTIVCAPANAPEVVVINGPLQYLDRLPLAGVPIKRALVLAVARRFTYVAQPNADAGAPLMRELRGTLTPGHVARTIAAYAADDAARAADSARLRALYAGHAGAAGRMADALLAYAR